jgi:hypothetical protein
MMLRSAVVLLALAACGKSKKTEQLDDTPWCADELTKIVVPELVRTYNGGDADAFHRATESFTKGTMCGPDFANVVADWELSLRATDASVGQDKRKALVVSMRDDVTKPQPDYDFALEKKALAPLFDKAK